MDQLAHRFDVAEGLVAFGPAARHDGALLFDALTQAWPVEPTAPFNALLHEIDEADCQPEISRHA